MRFEPELLEPFLVTSDRIVRFVGKYLEGHNPVAIPATQEAVAVGDGNAEQGAIEVESLAQQMSGRNALIERRQNTAGFQDDRFGQVGEIDRVVGKTLLPLVFGDRVSC